MLKQAVGNRWLTVGMVLLVVTGVLMLSWQLVGSLGASPSVPSAMPPPMVVPGEPQVDRHLKMEQDLRQVMFNFPQEDIIWVNHDTVVYLLPADPHVLDGPKVAIAHHLPTAAAIVYNLDTTGNHIELLGEDVAHHPNAPMFAIHMDGDPNVRTAVITLLGRAP